MDASAHEKMLQRERKERGERMYNSPGMQKLRADEAGLRLTPECELRIWQADDRSARERDQRKESERLRHRQEMERNQHLGTSRPMPHDLQKRHARERTDMEARHQKERGKTG